MTGAANGRDQPLATSPEVRRRSDAGRKPTPEFETGITPAELATGLTAPVPGAICDKKGGTEAGT